MQRLTFDEARHIYYVDGLSIPSVTQIMKPLNYSIYKGINSDILNSAADRGTRVHRAIEFYSKYKWDKCDGDICGYFEAYKKFKSEHKDWKLMESEYRTYHKSLLYGLTIDEVYETPSGTVICDIKTPKIPHLKNWSVQLSAYKAGYSKNKKISKIIVLQLFENGNYTVHELEDNFNIFLACLEIYRFGEI